ncbi:MAG: hypothetical protein IJC41_03220 [Firmicutes bacterium]|nr:hypothetical protein [Bacillota bacterium]
MAIKDKLGAIAKTAADKTGDVVETTKLNIKVNEEKGKIKELMAEVGKYYYEKFRGGEELPVEVVDLFCKIKDAEAAIDDMQEQIRSVKNK